MKHKSLILVGLFVIFGLIVTGCGGETTAPAEEAQVPAPAEESQAPAPAPDFIPASVCVVPDVVGLDQTAAEGMLTGLGLQPVKSSQYDPTVAKGAVISQEPSADTRMEPCEGDVTIVISLGPVPQPTATPALTDTPAPPSTPVPTSTLEPTPIPIPFQEEFTGSSLDQSRWEVTGPPIRMEGESIHLESNLSVFPYIYAKQNPFPVEGNFVLETSLRYPVIKGRGVGLVAANAIPPVGEDAFHPDRSFLMIWQDARRSFNVWFSGNSVYVSSGNDLSRHTVEVQYDGKYHVLVDGNLVFTSQATKDRPSALWFGNPVNVGSNGEWSSLEVDYIYIKATE